MANLSKTPRVDYLVIGHVTLDKTPQGLVPGGTAAYAALTARAMGLRVGIVTSARADFPLDALSGVQILRYDAEQNTVFENEETASGRRQILHHRAAALHWDNVPAVWRQSPIIHLAPVADEIPLSWDETWAAKVVGVTPQGWLREWDAAGRIRYRQRPALLDVMERAGVAVLSLEDVGGDEDLIDEMALRTAVLALTEGSEGVRLYWRGDVRRFRPPKTKTLDTTGAGDIFAAAFFIRLYLTRDPWESARFATRLAAISVTRRGLESVPTAEEIKASQVEVL